MANVKLPKGCDNPLNAISYAIHCGYEAHVFLEAWNVGDVSEWPEFVDRYASAADAARCKATLEMFKDES